MLLFLFFFFITNRNTILITHHQYEYVIMFVKRKYDDGLEMFRESLYGLDLIHGQYYCLLKNAKIKVLEKKSLNYSLSFLTELAAVTKGLISKLR